MGERCLDYGAAKVIRLGGPLVSAHLLVDEAGLTLIDTGLWGIPTELRRVVAGLGRKSAELRDIVLTHGHLDHVAGAAEIQEWSGARVWVHAADREHVAQRVRYAGMARGCGGLERAGRLVGRLKGERFRAPRVEGELRDGAVLSLWGGLRVWHLPGHTPGHCALVAERAEARGGGRGSDAGADAGDGVPPRDADGRRGLVFGGDLFASYAWSVHRPPYFLTRDRARAEESLRALAAWVGETGAGVLPSHYDRMDPALHARRLADLASKARRAA